MRAEAKSIEANDIPEWPGWRSPTPDDELRWFTVSVGVQEASGADLFQVAVATPRGIQGRRDRGPFVGLVVDSFEPSAVEQAIRDYVASIEGPAWELIVRRLQAKMLWEYQGCQRS